VLFNSLLYLVFLAVAVIGSWLLVRRQALRLAFLLVASCLFYMAWNPVFILLILGSTCWDFTVARLIERTPDVQKVQRRLLLLASVGMNLTLLCYFKYLNFFLQSFDASMRALGWDPAIPVFAIVLPVGISFYTFQTMSYCIDVYRREIPAEKNLLRFALFSTFFPQLVAGPIVRAQVFLPQLHRMPTLSQEDVGEGLFRIARGLAKKVVIADYLAVNLVDRVFSQPHVYSSAEVLVGLYAYTLQIYCDFSGYTDVAIGSARLLGYRLPENFMRPYRARTVAEFWRRWHMTLSSWLRHYVFFPLGGSKGPLWKAQRNTFITLVLIGLWHGANWTFVLYGMLHAFAIMLNRLQNRPRASPTMARRGGRTAGRSL
jgi:alginate O-acetyltransferase complex protein AlgI